MTKNWTISVAVTTDLHSRVKTAASRNNTSVTAWLTKLIEEALAREEEKKNG